MINVGIELFFIGKFLNEDWIGIYCCVRCYNVFFCFDIKFDVGCGWLSFYEVILDNVLCYLDDYSLGCYCIEICCGMCDLYLGYVFYDGLELIGLCFCLNFVVFNFKWDEIGEDVDGWLFF